MKKLRKLMAAVIALPLAFAAMPAVTPVSAVVPTDIPEWVPTDFETAMKFANTYGATHIEDGLLCIVKTRDNNENLKYEVNFGGTSKPAVIADTLISYVPSLDASPDIFLHKPDYGFDVKVYDFEKSGSFSFEQTCYYYQNEQSSVQYTFEIDDDLNITETDIYSWLPDCSGEYDAYNAKNGTLSLHDNYLVVCDTDTDGMTTDQTLFQEGKGQFEEIFKRNYFPLSIEPLGGFSDMIRLYEPTSAGLVKTTWETKLNSGELISSTTKSFRIGIDMTTYPVSDNEFDNVNKADINGDGRLTVADTVLFQGYLIGGWRYEDYKMPDLCEDGRIDVFDLVIMRRLLTSGNEFIVDQGYDYLYGGIYQEDSVALANSMDELLTIIDENECCHDDEFNVSAEELVPNNVNSDFFDSYSLVVIYTKSGSSSRKISYEGCEKQGSVLTVNTSTYTPMIVTCDEVYNRMLVAVSKSTVSGVEKVVRNSKDIHEKPDYSGEFD